MLKFFACYIWLILGFLSAFMTLFSSEEIFKSFPVPLITMMVWMTGEVDSDILHPTTRNIKLIKDKENPQWDPRKPEYVGYQRESKDYLQFEGNIVVKLFWNCKTLPSPQALPTCSLLLMSSCSQLSSWTSWLVWLSVTLEPWWRVPGRSPSYRRSTWSLRCLTDATPSPTNTAFLNVLRNFLKGELQN